MKLNLQITKIFKRNKESNANIVLNRGGTRSSKTYSLCQLMLMKLVSEPDKRILIARKTFPALRNSVYKDMIELLIETDIMTQGTHNKAEHTFIYHPTRSQIVFASIDDPQKFRGAEWSYAWLNEANEFNYEDFNQIYLRMSRKSKDKKKNQVYLDFNPSDMFSWIKTELEDKKRADVILSTYKDNSFLDTETVKRIEWLKENDKSFWKIYGLGEWTTISGLIYTNWDTVEEMPEDVKFSVLGLDFGYTNDPTALVKIAFKEGVFYLDELIYKTGLTNQDIGEEMKQLKLSRNDTIFADSSEPKSIEELYRMGYKGIKPTKKGRDSVINGIDVVKSYQLRITTRSTNILKEIRGYKWMEDKNNNLINKPTNYNDHMMDAMRYAITMGINKIRRKVKAYG